MSVLLTLRVPVQTDNFARAAEEHNELFRSIAADARGRGCIHHDFYAGDGEVVVVDEWESAEAFQSFYEDQGPRIGELMAAAQAGQPAPPMFYEKLSLGDQF
jgi:heme-degrading monooxygenase HmoA